MIKFRAWDSYQRKMYSWADLGAMDEKKYLSLWNTLIGEVEHVKPLQYTGLCDKNGVEIYEGDLLRLPPKDDWEEKSFASFEVFWHDNDCSPTDVGLCLGRAKFYGNLAGGYCGYTLIPRDVGRMVVIGNRFEHPELLEQSK